MFKCLICEQPISANAIDVGFGDFVHKECLPFYYEGEECILDEENEYVEYPQHSDKGY